MNKRLLTSEQVADLLKNPNVVKCSDKRISYSSDFKILAVKQYQEEGLPVKYIFEKAGFDLSVIGKDTPKWCLKDWRKEAKRKGSDKIGTKKPSNAGLRTKGMTDAEKIIRLEATVAYLKAENDFLVKLRAKKKS